MSDTTTIARPYAKAVFNHALAAKQLTAWTSTLQTLATSVLDSKVEEFIYNPSVTAAQQVALLKSLCESSGKGVDERALENLLNLLATNKRLGVLPGIYIQYEALRAEQEKTLTANVTSFSALTSKEQSDLVTALSQRLKRQVTLELKIDPSLLGGAVICAGDLVIDGSVRGKLNKLGNHLAV